MRIGVIEDDSRYREGLRALLSHAPGLALAGCWSNASEALAALENTPADLVLMDVELPGLGGVEATRRLKKRQPETLVVMLTVFEEPAVILEAICAGADGYLLKKTPPAELIEHVRLVGAGGSAIGSDVARTVLDLVRGGTGAGSRSGARGPAADAGLSPREMDVLRGLTRGLAYKQVAGELGVSIDTVRTHIRGVYRKLQVHSVAEAVGRALRERLVD
jgi:DNA-binding NarL/FixJ family response regulator